jgi:hypothetical protein
MRALAASTLLCCLLLAGEVEGEYQGPDYVKLKALLPPSPDAAAFASPGPMTRRTSSSTRSKRSPR